MFLINYFKAERSLFSSGAKNRWEFQDDLIKMLCIKSTHSLRHQNSGPPCGRWGAEGRGRAQGAIRGLLFLELGVGYTGVFSW